MSRYLPDAYTETQPGPNSPSIAVRPISPAGQTGAFGLLLATPEYVILHLQFPYGINSDIVDASGVFGAFVTGTDHMAVVCAGSGVNGNASLESHNAARYVPGQGMKVKFAGHFSSPRTGSFMEAGIGDDTDGYFFGYSGSDFGSCRRRAGVDSWTLSSSWNIDKMNSTGPSGATFVPSFGNVYMIKYQWLGFGAITWLVENSASGDFVPVHQERYASSHRFPSIFNPTLPLRVAARNAGNTVPVSASISSMAALAEGPPPTEGVRRSVNRNISGVSSEVTVLTIRNDPSLNGQLNRVRTLVDFVSVSNRTANVQVQFRLILNASLATANFQNLSPGNSVTSLDVAGTGSAGRELFSIELASSADHTIDLSPYQFRLSPGDTLTVNASATNSSTVAVGVSVKEEF